VHQRELAGGRTIEDAGEDFVSDDDSLGSTRPGKIDSAQVAMRFVVVTGNGSN
jgi:hypothetical protein